VLTGFFGVGGGFVIVPALILVLGMRATTATGTSLLFRLGTGVELDWPVLALFTVAAVAGAQVGALLIRHTEQRRV
jgi:uncharacterized membrane protein YfcA